MTKSRGITESGEDAWIEVENADRHVFDHLPRWFREFRSIRGLLDRINEADAFIGEGVREIDIDGDKGWELKWAERSARVFLKETGWEARVVNGVKVLISKCDLFDVYEGRG